MKKRLSRRDILRAGASLFIVAGASSCRPKDAFSCVGATGLSVDETKLRTTLLYVDAALDPTKSCATCAQFIEAPAEGTCGSCKLMRGPIHPSGTCKVYSPKG